MRTYSKITTTGAALATLLFAFSAFARDRTLLNGTWTLVPTESDFAGQPVIQTGTVTINEQDGDITVLAVSRMKASAIRSSTKTSLTARIARRFTAARNSRARPSGIMTFSR